MKRRYLIAGVAIVALAVAVVHATTGVVNRTTPEEEKIATLEERIAELERIVNNLHSAGGEQVVPDATQSAKGWLEGTRGWVQAGNRLQPAGDWGISMRGGNVFHGTCDSTHVNLGIACTTGTSGFNHKYCTVGGGFRNRASGDRATVGGGLRNTASGWATTVSGGGRNTASGSDATVGGGWINTASGGYATVSGGFHNTASGLNATVGGGEACTVAGDWSFAVGQRVRLTDAADNTFGFGRDFTTSTPNAVIFHNTFAPISVGIGTVTPAQPLHVVGNIRFTGVSRAGDGTTAAPAYTFDGDPDVGLSRPTADVLAISTAALERMRIDAVGNVGIGTTTPGTHRLHVVGTAGLTTGTAWTNTSDSRWKNVQSELNGSSLDKILALRPVSYKWNDLHTRQFGENPGLKYGFIAQEIKEVISETVSQDADGFYWYNPSGMEAILTAAIQEQQKQIENLEKEIRDLKARLNDGQ